MFVNGRTPVDRARKRSAIPRSRVSSGQPGYGRFAAPTARRKGVDMTPRFFFDEPRPASVADRLLESAESLEVKIFRRANGGITAAIELRSVFGADFLDDDEDDSDLMEQDRKSMEALALCRQLLCSFAAAGKAGDA